MSYYDLGTHSREIRTASDKAQLWFDRGLVWTYGYNHEEAISCFERALECDPGCAMAHWGIAYAIGPNYNKPWSAFEEDEKPAFVDRARRAAHEARRCVEAAGDGADPVEKALIDAIAARCPDGPPPESFAPYHDAFVAAMRDVCASHPDDLDVASVFVEALMNRTPWALWDVAAGTPAEGADTLEAIRVLERAFQGGDGDSERGGRAWRHPGLLHMYVHLMEMSPHPERALRHGDALVGLVPDAGHLVHMATHIDVLCGEYHNVVARNHLAILADRKFLAREGADNFYTVYRCHNYHFKIYGAMFLGQRTVALESAHDLIGAIPEPFLRRMADWFEAFVPMKQHVLIRFGLWSDILEQSLPQDAELYCVTLAMMRYARAVALSNLGRTEEARAERELFLSAREAVPQSRMLFNNTCRDILAVAEQMMLGEIEYHGGNRDAAFEHLREAVRRDDGLPYDEPWGWMQPARHALGALLLESGRVEEAEAVYRADLGLDDTLSRPCRHPGNVWSLRGLSECLGRMGGKEASEARWIEMALRKAEARAEVPIRASCYCSRGAPE